MTFGFGPEDIRARAEYAKYRAIRNDDPIPLAQVGFAFGELGGRTFTGVAAGGAILGTAARVAPTATAYMANTSTAGGGLMQAAGYSGAVTHGMLSLEQAVRAENAYEFTTGMIGVAEAAAIPEIIDPKHLSMRTGGIGDLSAKCQKPRIVGASQRAKHQYPKTRNYPLGTRKAIELAEKNGLVIPDDVVSAASITDQWTWMLMAGTTSPVTNPQTILLRGLSSPKVVRYTSIFTETYI
ncbi:MAG: hypothetical protein AAF385_17895 [Pseudomonadota bacterium]